MCSFYLFTRKGKSHEFHADHQVLWACQRSLRPVPCPGRGGTPRDWPLAVVAPQDDGGPGVCILRALSAAVCFLAHHLPDPWFLPLHGRCV